MVALDALDTLVPLQAASGGLADQTLTGTAGYDNLVGSTGDDTLTGGAGDDTLVGGEGLDTAIFSGNQSEYSIVEDTQSGDWTVTHLNDGVDGTDIVREIELFEFADGVFDPTAVTNTAPTVDAGIAGQAATEDAAFSFAIPADAFADADVGDVLTFTATLADGSDLPSWLTLVGTSFSGTPTNGDVGALSVKVTATDTSGASIETTFALAIGNTNDAPTVDAGIAAQAATEDAAFTFAIPVDAFADEDIGDVLSYAATLADGSALPSWLTFDGTSFSGTPANGDAGIVSVKVTATDGSGASIDTSFDVNVATGNQSPTTSGGTISLPVNGAATGQLHASDAETASASLTYSLGTAAANGVAVINADGSYTYTPTASYSGADGFTYTVADGNGGTVTGTITVDVYQGGSAPSESALLAEAATNFGSGVVNLGRDPGFFNLTDMTFSATFELNDLVTTGQRVFNNHTNFLVGVSNDDMYVYISDDNNDMQFLPTIQNVFTQAGWQDIQVVLDGTAQTMEVWVNGANVHTYTNTNYAIPDVETWDITAGGTAWGNELNGRVADVTVLNSVQTIDGSQTIYERMVALDALDTLVPLQTEADLLAEAATNFGSGMVNLGRDPGFFNLTDMTFSATFELNDLVTTGQRVFNNHTKMSLHISQDDLRVRVEDVNGVEQDFWVYDVFTVAGWQDVQVVLDSTAQTIDIWVNGVVVRSDVNTNLQISDVGNWDLAAGGSQFGGLLLNGRVADVTILNSVQTIDGSQTIYERMVALDALDTLVPLQAASGGLADQTLTGTAGHDNLVGSTGDDTLTGAAGDDTLTGGDGADTYEFTRGDGQDTIIDTSADGASDTLVLDTGIDHDQLWFEQTGDDLLISVIGTSDQITVENWYASADNKIENIETGDGKVADFSGVEALVSAMASFSPPGGAATDLSDPAYDPLDSVLTTNWQAGI
ncbi:putative Ig domain-containing protein [Sneathiella marina]|uniref:Ig domain-containing protein n=2 Tax=Sneathiella marina TaxID=2950108 RepID=A0ABY4WAU2_9PROT|nr:putative Ig domain-containing protein [Sneathiella marina]